MRKRQFIGWFVILLILIPLTIQAEGQSEIRQSEDNPLAQYNNSIQFYVPSGVSVAYNKIMSEKSALRFHLDLTGSISDEYYDKEGYQETENDTATSEADYNYKDNYIDVALSVELINTFIQKKIIRFYYGGGPYVEYYRSESNNHGVYDKGSYEENYYNYKSTINGLSAGLCGTMGLELSVAKRVCLFAEHQILLYHKWRKSNSVTKNVYGDDDISYSTADTNSNSWDFEFDNIKIGVSVYF